MASGYSQGNFKRHFMKANPDKLSLLIPYYQEAQSMSNEEIVEQIQKGIDVPLNQEKLWKQNRLFVRYQVRKLCGITEKNNDFEDFEQEGAIGLLTAAIKYDKSRGTNFLTCAGWYVKSAIMRYGENCSSSVRMPVYLKERIRKYASFRQQYRNENGRDPTRAECLAELNISERSLTHLEKAIYNMKAVSLEQNVSSGDGETSLLEMLQSDENMEELITYSIYSKELKKELDEALSILDSDTRMIIQSLYYQKTSMKKTAEIFGCSKQAIYEKSRAGFWKILHSSHRGRLESFMWDGYRFNEYAYSEFADTEDEGNDFLI